MTRDCLRGRHSDDLALAGAIAAYETRGNLAKATIDWRFSTQDARTKLHRLYPCNSWIDPVLAWLQAEPDATGTALIKRLQIEHRERFSEAQLRTMQLRLKEWRGIVAKDLVYAGTAVASTPPNRPSEMAPVGTDPRR